MTQNSAENSGPVRDEGGRLRGGNPGNSGGKKGRSGRPRGVIRDACAKAFSQRVKYLRDVIDGKTGPYLLGKDDKPVLLDGKPVRVGAEVTERLKAIDLLGKYGLGTTMTATDTEGDDAPGQLSREEIEAEVRKILHGE